MYKVFLSILLIVSCNLAKAQFSIELNGRNESLAAYIRDFRYLDQNNRLSFFTSNQITVNYDGSRPGFFSFCNLVYNFRSGLGIGANLITDNKGVQPSAAIQYKKTLGSFFFFILSSYELNKYARQDNYMTLIYTRSLSKKVKLIVQNENYFSFQKWGYDQSVHRIKPGFGIGQTQVGFFSETSQKGKSFNTMVLNWGCFLKQSF